MENNKDVDSKKKEYDKRYYEKNRERLLKRNKEYYRQTYKEKKEQILEKNREYKRRIRPRPTPKTINIIGVEYKDEIISLLKNFDTSPVKCLRIVHYHCIINDERIKYNKMSIPKQIERMIKDLKQWIKNLPEHD